MAPRRGGGGGWSSGGASCEYCNVPLTLRGDDWLNPTTNALFAFQIIALIVMVVCMVLRRRFKWIRQSGTDKLRNSGYFFAAFCMFIYFILTVTITALMETRTETTFSFFIVYIFKNFFFMIGEVMIVAIIARTIAEDMGSLTSKITTANGAIIGFFWVFAIVAFGFNAAYFGVYVSLGGTLRITVEGMAYSNLAYQAYALAVTLYLVVLAIVAVLKQSSTGGHLMLFIVIPSLFFRFLIGLIGEAVGDFQGTTYAVITLLNAYAFILVFTTMSLFLTMALIGGLRQRHSGIGMSQDQKLGQSGPHYVAVGPYAPPPAPYGAHVPVGPYPQPTQYSAHGQPAQQQYGPTYATQEQYGAPGQQIQYAQPGQYAAPAAVPGALYPGGSSVSPPPPHVTTH